ncbi:MAG TPA: cellulase family glycosylhydrolase [Mycobacterium sp.]|nr:cellulase family glycosylhydrolase [Mycobacterium sp.]
MAVGLAPVLGAPVAGADGWDDVIDAALSPAADAATASGLAAASTADAGGEIGQALQADSYLSLHTALEDWIHSSEGQQVDAVINKAVGVFLIGDGAAGTAAHPAGGAGGLLFGDGGAGWNSTEAGVAGGVGGAGGAIGNGGAGGAGGLGADGGDGGDGGQWLGNGGDGGAAGRGAGSDGLPALGGAGGNAGGLGEHGAVGQFGIIAGVSPSGNSALTATGNWLTNSDGQAVILHGVNMVQAGKGALFLPSDITNDSAAFLAANGVNAVRVGVQWQGLEPEPGVFSSAYLAQIDQAVQILANHGIRSVLDMHQDGYGSEVGFDGAPAWATDTGGLPNLNTVPFPFGYPLNPAGNHAWDTFWANGQVAQGIRLENNYAQMWQHVAEYFKNDPDVVGYEIMNEPWAGSQWLGTLSGNPQFGTQVLTPFYNQVDSAIRSVDPATPVFFEPNVLEQEAAPINLGTVNDPNSVFSFHPYCLTTALIPTSSLGCAAYEDLLQGGAETYAKAHGIPAMLTEWGNTTNTDTLNTTMNEANHNGFGWLYWEYENLVHTVGQPPTGSNVDTALLDTLAQPYPQVVSGTPGAWSFENGTFQFSYSTAMPAGHGDFPAGSQTTIAVPATNYANGYQVSVTGGHVVSAADAPELVIASNSGASAVSVTVTAASAAGAK